MFWRNCLIFELLDHFVLSERHKLGLYKIHSPTLWKSPSCCPSSPPAWSWNRQSSTPSPRWTSPPPSHRQTLGSIRSWSRPGTPRRRQQREGCEGRPLCLLRIQSPWMTRCVLWDTWTCSPRWACCGSPSSCASRSTSVGGWAPGVHGPYTCVSCGNNMRKFPYLYKMLYKAFR